MSVVARIKQVGAVFGKRRGPEAGTRPTRIQRRARDLMSFASVFAFCTVVWWLLMALLLWQARGSGSSDPALAQHLLEHWHLLPKTSYNVSMLAFAWVLGFAVAMAPIICLRKLGEALYTQVPLSFAVARRFTWLGHALVVNIVGGFAVGWVVASQIAQYQLSFSLGFLGTLTAAILAYVVAEMVREGARAAEENRAFI